VLLTILSSEIPPNALMIRLLNPLPAAVNTELGFPAPTINSLAAVVVPGPLFAVVPLPVAAALTSSGLVVSSPLYSSAFTFGKAALLLNFTVTVLLPAAIFFA